MNYGFCLGSNTNHALATKMTTNSNNNNYDQQRWFVMRAYKCESKAEERLNGKGGLRHFIPKEYAIRTYHGAKSRRLVPVIPSLVFVRASRREIITFKKDNNFLQYVMCKDGDGSDFMVVPDNQMENFIKVASHPEETLRYLKPEEIDISKGTRIKIIGGVFDGVEGIFMKTEGARDRRVVVKLEGVLAVAAKVHPDFIEVLP